MVVLNGANILPLRHIFRNAFPPHAGSIFESLPGVLNQLEQDKHLALLAPTYKHSKESTRALFVQPLETETLRKFGQADALPNVASICKKIARKTFDIRFNFVELDALAKQT